MATSEPTYNPTEAALACGVSLDTVRRRIRAGKIPGAHRRGDEPFGEWVLPRSGLEAAGLTVRTDATAPAAPRAAQHAGEIAELRAEVVRWQVRAEAAERLVEELRGEIAFNRRVLKQLAGTGRAA